MFVGVNNHKQTVIFGAALLYAEITSTFKWLFDTFAKRLVEDHHYEELNADFKASQSSLALSFPVEILKHVASVYTPKVFTIFQNELFKAHDCVLNFLGEGGTVSKYGLALHGRHVYHTVTYDSINITISCSCKKFEFAGMLCAHALKVLSTKNIKSILTQYILKRLTRNVKDKSAKSTCMTTSENDPKLEVMRRYREICQLNIQLAIRASESQQAYEITIRALTNTLADVDASFKENTIKKAPQVLSPAVNNVSPLEENIYVDGDHNTRGRALPYAYEFFAPWFNAWTWKRRTLEAIMRKKESRAT
ncbi:hypothetical protein ACFX19_044410 [Malus domestica]